MKVPSAVATITLGLALSVPAVQDVQAAYTGIQRCRAADGTAVYTDKPCTMVGAQSDVMSGELSMRLRSEAMRDPAAEGLHNASFAQAASMPVGRRSAASGCARSTTQLAMDIQGSVALHDVNRLAESYHWVGMGHRESIPVMQRLDRVSRGQVVATQYFDAQIGSAYGFASNGEGFPDDGAAGILQVQLAGNDGAQSLELNVERYAGCYFIRF
ncbi:hypothetical protein [Lysobacter humi (ex Lee et al. 2017)]